MLNLLLVDDEVLIADGVYDSLKDEHLEDVALMKAYSARDALRLAGEKRIDILLTDIKMPELDGFALYDELLRAWPQCRVIFLTGHESFDYAYRAIQYRDVRYVIKADGIRRVLEAVREALAELEKLYAKEAADAFDLEKEGRSLYIRDAFLRYLNGQTELPELSAQLREASSPMDTFGTFSLAAGRFDRNKKGVTYNQWILFADSLNRLMEEHLHPLYRCTSIPMQNVVFWLIQSAGDTAIREEGHLGNLLELFQLHCERALATDSLLVVHPMGALEALRGVFAVMREGVDALPISAGNYFTYEDMRRLSGTSELAAEVGGSVDVAHIPRLERWLTQRDETHFREELEPMLAVLERTKNKHNLSATELYMQLSVLLLRYIRTQKLYEQLPFELPLLPLTNSESFAGWEEAAAYLRALTAAMFRLERERDNRDTDLLTAKIIGLVENNLENDVTVAWLADELHFNAGYLSRFFKSNRMQNLSDYIIGRKMKRAARLLTETDSKVQRIGERLGYSSPANFIRSFKKYYGVTPMEYRRG